jgi:hypothetical protein
MSCKACGAREQRPFPAEIFIHFPGLKDVGVHPVSVFPELLICARCGGAEFAVPEPQLHLLLKSEGRTPT